MSIRAVIFDFGGVLVRMEDLSGQRKWEKRLGLREGDLADAVFRSEVTDRSMIGEATEADVWNHVGASYGLNDQERDELRRDFWSGDQLDAELVRFLRGLRPRCKSAILSNAWPGSREIFNQKFGLGDVVNEMIISAEERVAKPDARIYQITLSRLGVQPEDAIFVDDLAENVRGARAIGIPSIRFESTEQTIAEVQEFLDGRAE
jgi:epoxide hydrolase-like predicted phosphatase